VLGIKATALRASSNSVTIQKKEKEELKIQRAKVHGGEGFHLIPWASCNEVLKLFLFITRGTALSFFRRVESSDYGLKLASEKKYETILEMPGGRWMQSDSWSAGGSA